jgi:hypothetical protein
MCGGEGRETGDKDPRSKERGIRRGHGEKASFTTERHDALRFSTSMIESLMHRGNAWSL